MAVNLPEIEISFHQKAGTLMERSERGNAGLIVRDDTDKSFRWRKYTDLTALEADKERFTPDNYRAISDPLAFAPFRTYVFRISEDETLADALKFVLKKMKNGWITVVSMTPEDATALASWIKAQEKQGKGYKAVVYKPSVAPNSMHIVDFGNESVTFTDDRGSQSGAAYLPSLVGILAVCNVLRGCTRYLCSNLKEVDDFEDPNGELAKGKFILCNDDEDTVVVGQGNNSLTDLNGDTYTEDMQYIEVVEAMDLIRDDITTTFRETYQGKYRNNQDNQMLFISALNFSYFRQLEEEKILDGNNSNKAFIDADAQRAAWLASGKEEAADWDDDTVKAMSFKRSVFLGANLKILQSMNDLYFPINLV